MKKTTYYLISLLAVMILSIGAMAQGGLTPLVNSTHSYTVTPESGTNTLAWTVTPATGYTIISGDATASVSIRWTTPGTYTLQFTEEDASTHCTTVIQKTVEVGNNTFDVTTPSLLSDLCNEASGVINFASSTVATTVQYSINMATGVSSWNPNWEFTFTLTPGSGTTISGVDSSTGTLSGPVAGVYTVTGVTSASGTGSTTITLELTGDINTAHTVAIAITSAKELQYNTPSNDTGNKNATQTINAIPATTGFSAN